MTKLFKADCYFQEEKYNPRIRATVPPAWVIEFDCALPNLAEQTVLRNFRVPAADTNVPPVFYGISRREVIQNAIDCLKSMGLTGRLILN